MRPRYFCGWRNTVKCQGLCVSLENMPLSDYVLLFGGDRKWNPSNSHLSNCIPLLWLEYFQQHRKLWILWSQYGDLFYQSSTVRYLKCSCWLTKSWNLIYIVSFTNTVVDGMLRLKQHHNNCFLQNKENRNFCFVCIVITYMISKIACNFNEFMPLLYSMSVCITDFIAD